MSHGVRDQAPDDARIEHHYGACDGRHAAAHQCEQLAAGEPRQVRLDQQGGLGHTDEDVGCRSQTEGAADAERLLQQPGHSIHQQRQYPPVEEH